MFKNAFQRLLLLLSGLLLFLAPVQGQYTIHDSQIRDARNWLFKTIAKALLFGLAAPLFLSALTYGALRAIYPYHTAKATLGLWLSCGIWWLGWALADANGNVSTGIRFLLVALTMGASAVGYSSSRKLKPDEE